MPGTKSVGLLLSGFALLMVNTAFAEETEITNSTNSETVAYESVVSDDCAAACDECCDPCCDSGCGSCCLMGPCCLGEPISLHDELFGDSDMGITVSGWTQWGYSNESTGLFNRNPNRVQNNQSWIYAEKVADGTCGFDWGFRADLMYGTDAFVSQSFGNPPGTFDFQNGWDHGIQGFALPQAYGEVAYGDLSVKVGHFATLVGYEVVTAPGNFFYSHAFTMFNNEPFWHTGAIGTYKVSDVLHSDLVETNLGGDHQFALNQYLFYKVNDCLSYGARGEWWKAGGTSLYEITGGVNYRPYANLVIRPEVRYQWASDDNIANNVLGIPTDEAIFGVDAIVTF